MSDNRPIGEYTGMPENGRSVKKGAMAERLKALDLKSSDSEKGPWVRIPLAPFKKRPG